MNTHPVLTAEIKAFENYMYKLIDENGEVHFLTGREFNMGAPRDIGAIVKLQYVTTPSSGLYRASKV